MKDSSQMCCGTSPFTMAWYSIKSSSKMLITRDILLIANLWYQKIHLYIEPSQTKKYFSDQNQQACNFEDENPPVVTNLNNISRLLKKCSGTINNLSKSS